MDTELGKLIAVFVMVILPIVFLLWSIARKFDSHDEEIIELKIGIIKLDEEIKELKKINRLEKEN